MTRTTPLRLGFFSYFEGVKSHPEIYDETFEIFIHADRLGLDTAWVAQHHFGHHGTMPSPFVFFAALAERTRQIGFGTAIIALPLEHPVRVAEDAAVLDAIHPGRLQLGVGTGLVSDAIMETFGQAGGNRREIYETSFRVLLDALEGAPLNSANDTLVPAASSLRKRIWESPASLERVAEVARRGNGLLLSRVAIGGGGRPTPEIQVPLVERYLAELPPGIEPRLGFSRTVYPSRYPEVAFRDLRHGLESTIDNQTAQGVPREFNLDDRFRHFNIHHGSPEQVVESLMAEPLIDVITDLIFQVQPGFPSKEHILEAIELTATEVAPALGWQPAGVANS